MLQETKKNLKDRMSAEYPATIEDALTVPGGAYFPEVSEDSLITDKELEGNTITYFSMDYGLDRMAAYWIKRDAFGNSQIIREHCESNLTIGAASETIKAITKGLIDNETIQGVALYLAPPDLWNRSQESGKSRAILFLENGVNLTKSSNDVDAGCAAMKEDLAHETGEKSRLTVLNNCAPELYDCLRKIQHDEKKPNRYANDPHNLTHAPDALRYYSIYWTTNASVKKDEKHAKWTDDMYEDFENAGDEDRKYLLAKWGEPG